MADFTRNTDGEEVKKFIKNAVPNETGCIPNGLIAKAMRMSMENKNVLLPEKSDINDNGVDVALAGSLYYANGFYNEVKGTDDAVVYHVPQTTRVEVEGSIASGSVLTFNRTDNGGAELIWNASTGGVTISFDTTTSTTSTEFGKWVSKTSSDTWPARYRLKLDLTALSKEVVTEPQLIVQLYEITASGIYNAVSSSMSIEKKEIEENGIKKPQIVLSLYSNKIWAGIASILQTGQVIQALKQQTQN